MYASSRSRLVQHIVLKLILVCLRMTWWGSQEWDTPSNCFAATSVYFMNSHISCVRRDDINFIGMRTGCETNSFGKRSLHTSLHEHTVLCTLLSFSISAPNRECSSPSSLPQSQTSIPINRHHVLANSPSTGASIVFLPFFWMKEIRTPRAEGIISR